MLDRNQMKKGLVERQKEQENYDSESGTFESYLSIPEGREQWMPKITEKGNNFLFDIVPFFVGSKYPTYPQIKRNGVSIASLEKGDSTYILNLFIHLNVGPQNLRVVCPLENYDLRCPICEEKFQKLSETNVKEERREIYKQYGTQHRVVYNVIVRDKGEEEQKGVQVLDYPYNWMERELKSRKTNKRTGEERFYSSPDKDGFSVYFEGVKKSEGKYDVSGYDLLERDYEITDEEIMSALPLDELVVVKSYEDLETLMKFKKKTPSTVVEEEPERPARTLTPKAKEETENLPDCPWGATFGENFDGFEQCNEQECDVFDDCKLYNEKKRAVKKPVPKPKPTPKVKDSMGDDVPF